MIVPSILTIVLLIVIFRQNRKIKLTEADLNRFRKHLCKGDAVRLHTGEMGIITFVGEQVAVVRLQSGVDVSVRKEIILPLFLN